MKWVPSYAAKLVYQFAACATNATVVRAAQNAQVAVVAALALAAALAAAAPAVASRSAARIWC